MVYKMETDIEFDQRIKLFEELNFVVNGKSEFVSIDDGTRVYREVSDAVNLQKWMDDVYATFSGEVVPFEWVADYVGVSRAALHKRIKRGGLTVLVFEMRERVPGILGGMRDRMRGEYKYVPRTECDSWRKLLASRFSEEERS